MTTMIVSLMEVQNNTKKYLDFMENGVEIIIMDGDKEIERFLPKNMAYHNDFSYKQNLSKYDIDKSKIKKSSL